MKVVRFRDRVAIPRFFKVGVEADHAAEKVKFELPQFDDSQVAALYWENEEHSDAEALPGGVLTVVNTMTQYPGRAECYINISVGTEIMWHSELFNMDIKGLPDTEEEISQAYPSAIQAGAVRAETAAREAEAAQDAAEAAQGAAEDAKGAAEAAQAAAEAYATAATGKAGEAALSAGAAAASAAAAEDAQAAAETAQTGAETAQAKLFNALDGLTTKTAFDFSSIGSDSYPLGWRTGYYDAAGAAISSHLYIRTLSMTAGLPQEADCVTVTPPEGYFCWINVYNGDGSFVAQYDTSREGQRYEGAPVSAPLVTGQTFRVSLGKFANADASAHLTQEFLATIKCELKQVKAVRDKVHEAEEAAEAAAASAADAAETAAQIVTDEAARQAAETARTQAELSRATAETARASAENSRATAETTRTNAESARMQNEAARQATEGTRASNETARQTAEAARVAAEEAREAAEAARERASAAAVQNAEDAADTANAAAEAVSGDIAELKSAITQDLYFHVTDTDAFAWKAGYRVNSTRKDYTTSNVSKYAGLYKNSSKDYLIVYPGSTITAKTGYTIDYAITSADHSTSIEGKRVISAGTTITIQHEGVLILSVTDETNDVTTDDAAKALAKAGLTIDLITSTEAATKVDKNQGIANAGKLLKVGDDGIVTPVTATDTTLQQAGAPADAKTVGENLLLSMDIGSIVFTIGGFNAAGSTNDTLTTQVRTKLPVKVGEYGGSIGCDEGYEIRVFNYSQATFSGKYLISKSNFTSNPVDLIPNTYVGFSIHNATPEEQSDVSNSEHFIINIPEKTVAQAVEALINVDISSYNHGPFDLYKERFGEWYSGLQSDYTGFVRTSKYADVITAFDALMALDTAYITKNSLGTASGTDSQGNSYTIYEYVFKPKNYSSTINTRKVPKIYMDGSIHGFEKCSTYGLYYFLKDLVTNWDKNPSLAAIRQSVEIHVIPVSNPYGFDNFQYKNGNSVNINRNFDHNGEWTVVPDGNDQNGLAAFDQPESAIIRDWILADEENILCYLNLHTNGQWNVSSYGEMNANMPSSDRFDKYYNRIFRVATNHIEEQTIRWALMYENIQPGSSAFCGKIQASVTESSTKGTASAWANTMRRIVAMTFEGFNGININDVQIVDTFSAQAQKMNSENIGNIVIQMLREYAD